LLQNISELLAQYIRAWYADRIAIQLFQTELGLPLGSDLLKSYLCSPFRRDVRVV
jgi:hypothetical protein